MLWLYINKAISSDPEVVSVPIVFISWSGYKSETGPNKTQDPPMIFKTPNASKFLFLVLVLFVVISCLVWQSHSHIYTKLEHLGEYSDSKPPFSQASQMGEYVTDEQDSKGPAWQTLIFLHLEVPSERTENG